MKKILMLCGAVALLALTVAAGDGKTMGCCAKQGAINRSVTNLDNGVRIAMTSTDAKVVAMLQEKAPSCTKGGCGDCPMHGEGVTRTVDTTADGVVVTATAIDAALVASLQKHAAADAASCTRSDAKASCCAKGKTDAAGCAHGAGAAPKTT
jgi:hypothetical protein